MKHLWAMSLVATSAAAETRDVFLQPTEGPLIQIATIEIADDRSYSLTLNDAAFRDHFLSMRPFQCLEGPAKHWCYVPYPYEIKRDISADFTDLEYDFMFVWKGATEYGINMWNGIYYKIEEAADGTLTGAVHEMDMDLLSAPPDAGVLRPLRAQDLHEGDPDSHWLPRLVIK